MTEVDFCVPARDEIRGFEMVMLSEENIERHWASIDGMMRQVPHTLGDWTPSSLYERAIHGQMQVWGVGDHHRILMVLFTQVAIYPAGRVLEIFWCAGQGLFDNAQELVDGTFDLFAKKENCHRIDVIGREGWEKMMKTRGFKRAWVTWSRPVTHEGMQ